MVVGSISVKYELLNVFSSVCLLYEWRSPVFSKYVLPHSGLKSWPSWRATTEKRMKMLMFANRKVNRGSIDVESDSRRCTGNALLHATTRAACWDRPGGKQLPVLGALDRLPL